jgi:tetratricopeptide (TPR) repeat protein
MSRWRFMPFWIAPVLLGAALQQSAQQPPPSQALPPDEDAKPQKATPAPAAGSDSDLPPDEDASASQETFTFNPVKSKNSVSVGEFYLKKGDYKAAALRFRDATQWNQGNAEAWLKLGEAEEKREQPKAARAAWQKYLQLAGNTKSAAEVKKKLEKLK